MGSAVLGARAVCLLAIVRFLLPRTGTTATLVRLARKQPARPARRPVDPTAALAKVRGAARVVGGQCLAQAVALTVLLDRGGCEPVLVLGCHRYQDGQWGAHAWVEVGDDVLDPQPAGEHTTLAWYRAARGWIPTAPADGRHPGRGAGTAS